MDSQVLDLGKVEAREDWVSPPKYLEECGDHGHIHERQKG